MWAALNDTVGYWLSAYILKIFNLPILRNNPHLGLLVPRPHSHTTPMRLRCPSTRAARVSISAVSCGREVA